MLSGDFSQIQVPFVIAGGHALPTFEPAEASFHGMAGLTPSCLCCWVQMFEMHAGIGGAELPVDALFIEALRGMARMDAPWHQLPAAYSKGSSVYRLRPRVRSGRLAAPDGLPAGRSGSVCRAAGQRGRARARERGWRTPKQRDGSRPPPSAVARAASAPRSMGWRLAASVPCACACLPLSATLNNSGLFKALLSNA